jgi:arsenate reductase
MAEGYAKALGQGIIEAQSAGIEAHGKNPRAIAVMAEDDVDLGAQESTRLSDAILHWADVVVTVCGHADEHCPVLPPGTRKEHWPLEDPAKATGSEAAMMATFRKVCDEIKQRVQQFINRLKTEATA